MLFLTISGKEIAEYLESTIPPPTPPPPPPPPPAPSSTSKEVAIGPRTQKAAPRASYVSKFPNLSPNSAHQVQASVYSSPEQ